MATPCHASRAPKASGLEESRHHKAHWKRWGPYVSERAWGTVREDYSADGDCVGLPAARPRPVARLPLERGRHRGHLRSSPDRLPRARALERARSDPRRSGCSASPAPEGNHGEDVKEYYFYLDSTPTHSYMRYSTSIRSRSIRTRCWSTRTAAVAARRPGVRAARHRDLRRRPLLRRVRSSTPSVDPDDLLIAGFGCTTVDPRRRRCIVLPTVWFRNTWSWSGETDRPSLVAMGDAPPALLAAAGELVTIRRAAGCMRRRRAGAALHRERAPTSSGSSASPRQAATSRTASTIGSSTAEARGREPCGTGDQGRGALSSRGAGRRTAWSCASALGQGAAGARRPRAVRSVRRDACATPAARPTSSTPGSSRRISPTMPAA